MIDMNLSVYVDNSIIFYSGRSQGGRGGATAPLAHQKKKTPNLISISLLLILIKNPNLIFSFDRNSNLDQSNTSIWTIFLILGGISSN